MPIPAGFSSQLAMLSGRRLAGRHAAGIINIHIALLTLLLYLSWPASCYASLRLSSSLFHLGSSGTARSGEAQTLRVAAQPIDQPHQEAGTGSSEPFTQLKDDIDNLTLAVMPSSHEPDISQTLSAPRPKQQQEDLASEDLSEDLDDFSRHQFGVKLLEPGSSVMYVEPAKSEHTLRLDTDAIHVSESQAVGVLATLHPASTEESPTSDTQVRH